MRSPWRGVFHAYPECTVFEYKMVPRPDSDNDDDVAEVRIRAGSAQAVALKDFPSHFRPVVRIYRYQPSAQLLDWEGDRCETVDQARMAAQAKKDEELEAYRMTTEEQRAYDAAEGTGNGGAPAMSIEDAIAAGERPAPEGEAE